MDQGAKGGLCEIGSEILGPIEGRDSIEERNGPVQVGPDSGLRGGGLSLRRKAETKFLKEKEHPQCLNGDLLIVGSRYQRVGVVC